MKVGLGGLSLFAAESITVNRHTQPLLFKLNNHVI